MNTIIDQTIEKLKNSFATFFEGCHSIGEAEKYFTQMISNATLDLLTIYYQKFDQSIRENKKERKKQHLVVERLHEKREVQTTLGLLSVSRTYYRQNNEKYVYPIDEIMGVDSYQRISGETSDRLVNEAIRESYAKASQIATQGAISKQTVMNKIRKYYPTYVLPAVKKEVPVLHIDADEEHVHMQTGKPAIAPCITVYEGTDRSTSRHKCINAFSVGGFDIKPDDLWMKVLDEIEKHYNIENTQIYLHGDGASWIKKGLEWLHGAKYVLDPFHKNKAIKEAVANMSYEDNCTFQDKMHKCLNDGDKGAFLCVQAEMCELYPEQTENILSKTGYLLNNFDGITIRNTDEEARNNGATEPHISHGLSYRLSNRPLGWSQKTLTKFVPILAAQMATSKAPDRGDQSNRCTNYVKKTIGTKMQPNTAGLVDPENAVSIASTFSGKDNPIFNLLKQIWG